MKQRERGEYPISEGQKRSSGVVIAVLVMSFTAFAAIRWQERQVIGVAHAVGVTGLSAKAVQVVLDSCVEARRSGIDLATIRDRLEQIPFVSEAYVYFDGVRSVRAVVQERNPVGHVVLQDGEIRYVDVNGTVLPDAQVRTVHDVPLIRQVGDEPLAEWQRKAGSKMLQLARQHLTTALYESVSEVLIGERYTEMRTQFGTWKLSTPRTETSNDEAIAQAFDNLALYAQRAGMNCAQVVDLDLRWNKHVVVKRLG